LIKAGESPVIKGVRAGSESARSLGISSPTPSSDALLVAGSPRSFSGFFWCRVLPRCLGLFWIFWRQVLSGSFLIFLIFLFFLDFLDLLVCLVLCSPGAGPLVPGFGKNHSSSGFGVVETAITN